MRDVGSNLYLTAPNSPSMFGWGVFQSLTCMLSLSPRSGGMCLFGLNLANHQISPTRVDSVDTQSLPSLTASISPEIHRLVPQTDPPSTDYTPPPPLSPPRAILVKNVVYILRGTSRVNNP